MKDKETEKIKTVLSFYMLANNLKYLIVDERESVANQVYGSMILATAINSEYKRVDNLGETIRIILLKTINDYSKDKLFSILKKMDKGKEYIAKLSNYENMPCHSYNDFAFDCIEYELEMEKFLNVAYQKGLASVDDKKLYETAKNYGLFDEIGNDDKKNLEIFKFYCLNTVLKNKDRSGWDDYHWNVSADRREKISEHVVGTIALATALDSEFDFSANLDEVTSLLCIHELGEIEIGDITPFDEITPEQKEEIEHKAIIEVIGDLADKEKMAKSIFEFDERKSNMAKFAYYCDKLEADIQAKVYQDMGYQHPLTEQDNNVVLKNEKVKQMVTDGATTAFDIWYGWDKDIYKDSKVLAKTLNYVKNNRIKKYVNF